MALVIGAAASALLSASMMMLEMHMCTTFECCNHRWIPENKTALKEELVSKLYGQPFAQRILTKSIMNHWTEENAPLPLVRE